MQRSQDTTSAEPGLIEAAAKRRPEVEAQARCIAETLAVARFAPMPVLLAASACLPAFHAQRSWATAVDVFAGILALSVGIAAIAALFDPLRLSPDVIKAGRRIVCAAAAAFGGAWAMVPFMLLPTADGDQRLVVFAVTLAIMAFIPILLAPRPASLLFLAPIMVGGAAGCLMIGSSVGVNLAALLLGFGGAVASGSYCLHRRTVARLDAWPGAGERGDKLDLLAMCEEDPLASWFWQTTASLKLKGVSGRLASLAGFSIFSLEGKPVDKLFLGPRAAVALSASADALLAIVADHKPFRNIDVEHRSDEGKSTWWRLTGKPIFGERGLFAGYRCIGRDVSALYDAAGDIAFLTSHDRLTGLMGRERFAEVVAEECRVARADGTLRALLVLDIDGFKEINGRIGNAGGNGLLQTVASRLKRAAPRSASIARIGADEFGIVYAPSHRSSADAVVRTLYAALRAPFDIAEGDTKFDVSIGLALAPDHATESEDLVHKADLALRRAKSEGRSRFKLFAPEFERVSILERELESDIKLALARGEFELHYQPLFDLTEGKIVGFEALIRWASPTRGQVSPADFIPAAENSDVIVAIGRFVLLDACRAAASWSETVRIAVNISPQHLRSPEFMADVTLALKLSGLSPTRLEIEITEGVFLQNAAEAVGNLHALRAHGIRIALDDFGAGYSSLNYLTNFPVDKIKIDQSFISRLMDREEDRAIVDAILSLARKLGMRVTAEGVETAEQALSLKLRRCDDIQGFLVSKAQPVGEIETMFAALPAALRIKVPALFESPLAAAVAMRKRTAA